MLIRERYLKNIRPLYHLDLIKVIIGMRRCGKSCLLMQIRDELQAESIASDHTIYMNFEFLEFQELKDYKKLNDYIEALIKDNKKYYIMLDEVQYVKEFEKTINSLRAKYQCSIFITGSNSNMLSSDLATLLTGRYMEFAIYPFSFLEMLEMKKITIERDTLLPQLYDYLKWGGLPQRFELTNERNVFAYLQDVYNSILFKDVMARYNYKNQFILEKVIQYILDNIGNLFSANTIVKKFKEEKIRITPQEIYTCLSYLCKCMMVEKVSRYDIRGKKVLEFYEKYYAVDLGIANLNKHNIDMGSSFENLVYNELISNGYQVYIGKTYHGEVDFIAQREKKKCYIQVCYTLNDELIDISGKTTMQREYEAFDAIKDHEPKFVISIDPMDLSKNGIKHLNVVEFLLHGLPL